MLKKELVLIFIFILSFSFVNAQTSLSSGDLAIIGLDTAEDFSFVAFVDMEAGTEIYFTDEEADGDYTIGTGEGTVLYTSPAGGITAGIVITYNGNIDDFTITSDGEMALGNSGDGLLAYQGTNVGTVSTFLHAVGEDSGDIGSFPDGFSNYMTYGNDDGEYNGTRSGTASELMTAINNSSNWTTSGSGILPFDTTSFIITGGSSASLTISHTGLTESNLNGASISLVLSNETFSDFDSGDVTLNNAPDVTEVSIASNSDDTHATVTLTFDGTDFDTDITDFSITVSAAGLAGTSPVTSNDLTITAIIEPEPTLTISHAGLTETNLNGAIISLVLENDTFSDFGSGDVTLNNAPDVTEVSIASNSDDTHATVTLTFDGSDFDSDITDFSITVSADGLSGTSPVTSNNLTITAIIEPDPEPTNHVTGFEAAENGSNAIILSWTDAAGPNLPSGYLIKMNTSNSFSVPDDGTAIADDANNINIAFGVEIYDWTSLDSDTEYFFKIYPYSNSGDIINYKINDTVPVATATTGSGGTETFANFPETGSSYVSGSFTGQDGSTWTYADCRGDQQITDETPCLKSALTSHVTSGTISGGIATLTLMTIRLSP
ncbi:MAG: hypothetical protein K9M99_10985 [Candidatus Cloacimonetes bacterium]|nr:hypothetical protein [Candidatus Cloacimonadota bacterium]